MIEWKCPSCGYTNEYELNSNDGQDNEVEDECCFCNDEFKFYINFISELVLIED